MADAQNERGTSQDPYEGQPLQPVLQQPYQQPNERYITQPLPPCYPGVRLAPPSSQQQEYVTQRQLPLYQTSMVQVAQTSAVRRPTWEQHPDMVWGRPNLLPPLPTGAVTSSPSTISIPADSKQLVVVVNEEEDEAERQRRMEEADELAAKDVICCCLGCVFGWIIC